MLRGHLRFLIVLVGLAVVLIAADRATGQGGLITVAQPSDMVLQPDAGPGRARVVYQLDSEVDYALIFLNENDRGQTVVRDRLLPGGVGVGVVEPCAGGGSDLPGAEITMRYDVFKTVQERIGFGVHVFTLGPDTTAPVSLIRPFGETPVRPGERVSVSVAAGENDEGTWATGIQSIEILGPGAAELARWDDPNGGPRPCESKSRRAESRRSTRSRRMHVPATRSCWELVSQTGQTTPTSRTSSWSWETRCGKGRCRSART